MFRERLKSLSALVKAQEAGLVVVIILLSFYISLNSGSYTDAQTGHQVNTFFNLRSIMTLSSDTSLFAIMAVGATVVIISGGIDLSVGSIYALCAVTSALLLKSWGLTGGTAVAAAIALNLAIGAACGLLNGVMVAALRVHPFIITLGTLWIFRGISFVASKAVSVPFPDSATGVVKSNLGLQPGLYPVPFLITILVVVAAWLFLSRTVTGRNIYAFGGNAEASRYSGIRVNRIQVIVYLISGLTAGVASFIGTSYYSSASSADADGYELKVIASAVIGGASLTGGKGAALGALLGAILIMLIQAAITYLKLDRNYQQIIVGAAVVIAVLIDQGSRKLANRRVSG